MHEWSHFSRAALEPALIDLAKHVGNIVGFHGQDPSSVVARHELHGQPIEPSVRLEINLYLDDPGDTPERGVKRTLHLAIFLGCHLPHKRGGPLPESNVAW